MQLPPIRSRSPVLPLPALETNGRECKADRRWSWRSRTFQLKPGVMIGDIGKKMGRDGIDNGYIQVSSRGFPTLRNFRVAYSFPHTPGATITMTMTMIV